jgi:hypothetical protein
MNDNKYSTKPRAEVGYLIVYSDMQDSPAFNAMRPLAQLLVMKAKRFYDRKTQAPIRVSARTAAKLIGTSKDTALSHCREAVHYGCWRNHTAGHLGSKGKGVATSYILTDEKFRGKPATLDFLRWDGTPFHEQHTPAYDKRQARSLARLKARKPVSQLGAPHHKKTESRPRHTGNPVPDTQDTPVPDTQDTSQKIQQNPVPDTQDISREKLSVSTAPQPAVVSTAEPMPEPDTGGAKRRDATSLEQGLVEMVVVLRTFLRQATNADWLKHMQTHGNVSTSWFNRRLRILKQRRWIRVVGDTEDVAERVPEGSLFEVTELAPGASVAPMLNPCQDVGKAAREQLERLERLKRGTPPAA